MSKLPHLEVGLSRNYFVFELFCVEVIPCWSSSISELSHFGVTLFPSCFASELFRFGVALFRDVQFRCNSISKLFPRPLWTLFFLWKVDRRFRSSNKVNSDRTQLLYEANKNNLRNIKRRNTGKRTSSDRSRRKEKRNKMSKKMKKIVKEGEKLLFSTFPFTFFVLRPFTPTFEFLLVRVILHCLSGIDISVKGMINFFWVSDQHVEDI